MSAVASPGRRVALVAALLACAPPAERGDDERWIRTSWSPHVREVRDRGTGVLFSEFTGPVPRVDTLRFRAQPRDDAPLVAMVLTTYDGNGGWEYAILTREAAEPNLLEYGYEEAGVPVDSAAIGTADPWLRGILAHRADGTPVHGWAAVRAGESGRLAWATHIPEQMIFLPADWAGSFHASAGGPPVDAPEATARMSVHALEARPPWMQVRIVTPPAECEPDEGLPRTEMVRWLRYLDDRGRPLVWYYTRGC